VKVFFSQKYSETFAPLQVLTPHGDGFNFLMQELHTFYNYYISQNCHVHLINKHMVDSTLSYIQYTDLFINYF
jgi:hypothetical protein